MFDKLLNFYSKYPWVAIIIVIHWVATSYMIISKPDIDVSLVLGLAFIATIIFAQSGFKVPK